MVQCSFHENGVPFPNGPGVSEAPSILSALAIGGDEYGWSNNGKMLMHDYKRNGPKEYVDDKYWKEFDVIGCV